MTYVYEHTKTGKLVEMDFPMGTAPARVGLYKKILYGIQVKVGMRHKAANDAEIVESDALNRIAFETPDPITGVSDADLVKSGKAKTRDMKRWL